MKKCSLPCFSVVEVTAGGLSGKSATCGVAYRAVRPASFFLIRP
ncbi:MAG TPA: hypothetical protein PLN34_07150 [Alloprevotella sp.]|nr:hypothetical protein [Alloprevotella sp.]